MDKTFLHYGKRSARLPKQKVAILLLMEKTFLLHDDKCQRKNGEVAILILMEKTFLPFDDTFFCFWKYKVAILLLMEKTFLQTHNPEYANLANGVAILLLMEKTFLLLWKFAVNGSLLCRNPSFNGKDIPTQVYID